MGDVSRGDVSVSQIAAWLTRARGVIVANRDHLTELDSAIGDADHGTNLARGFTAVVHKLPAASAGGIGSLLRASGVALVSTVGGASGPLYGTMLLRMGKAVGDGDTVMGAQLGVALRAGLEGVMARGKAALGDKTMVDALHPAVEAYEQSLAADEDASAAARAAASAAAAGRDATEPLVARKGRASYLGERSAGHTDPGAASMALLLQALADALIDD
jgi:dihydroxyacetone kinase-like protein